MKRHAAAWAALAAAALTTGCVEQRYVVTSGSPCLPGQDLGATVYRNGVLIGQTPVDDHFVYYGKYHFTLVRDGYETVQIDQDIPAPWYEVPPLDFVSEVLYPFKLRDVRCFHYEMCELQRPRSEDVLNRGQQLRDRGKTLVPPQPEPPPSGPAVPLGPPAPAAPPAPVPDAPPSGP
jgi:hypothetical protein